ncbi:DUF1127 domain-containing protein [Rhodobacteraceae bacterium 2CG4]|uniref:DUF1127 domain-containing protein n=1 Tax=Halovulum marinum TaxID=2662447 RepID=A0A6L5YVL8_9RHOB|nr:DUF1127 domain-containing protein [Halovulum marinum]MSU88426.1 DUF1127 domain-containing protein [Halovulum marinum]
MATSTPPHPAPFGAHVIYRLVRAVEDLTGAYHRWTRRQRTAEMLAALSDHELDDVGMIRGERMAPRYSMLAARKL